MIKNSTLARFEGNTVILLAVRSYGGSKQYRVRYAGNKGKQITTKEFYVMESQLRPF